MCDNTSEINLTKKPVLHYRTKHIEIRHHQLHEHIEKGDVVFEHVDSKNQLVDIFIKPFEIEPFSTSIENWGLLTSPILLSFHAIAYTLYYYSNLGLTILHHMCETSIPSRVR